MIGEKSKLIYFNGSIFWTFFNKGLVKTFKTVIIGCSDSEENQFIILIAAINQIYKFIIIRINPINEAIRIFPQQIISVKKYSKDIRNSLITVIK